MPNLIENQIGKYDWFLHDGIQSILDEVFPIINKNGNIVIDLNGPVIFEEPTITPNKARLESKTYDKQLFLPIILMINDYELEINLTEVDADHDQTKVIQTFLEQKMKQKLELDFSDKQQLRFINNNQKLEVVVTIVETNQDFCRISLNVAKQNKVFLGYLPKMTHKGTFIVNGSEKVVVSQLVRSSGAYYKKTRNQKSGIYNYSFELIPNRGTWLEFETGFASPYDNPNLDISNLIYVKVDKSKKATLTNLFTVFGISRQDVETLFDKDYLFNNCYRQTGWTDNNHHNFEEAVLDIYKKIKTGESVNPEGGAKFIYSLLFDDRKYDLSKVGRYKFHRKLAIDQRIYGYTLAEPIYDASGEIFLKKGTVLKNKNFKKLQAALKDGFCTKNGDCEKRRRARCDYFEN